MKSVYNRILATVATLLALTSCDWLDVAPAKQATFDDAMKDKAHVEAWIYSCYKTVGTSAPGYAFNIEGSTDEFTTPKVWWANTVFRHPMAYATISSSSNQAQWWRELYGTIGHVHLFLRELDRQNPSFLTEDDKALYRAHASFIKAFNYFKILFYFGPCPIIDEYVGSDTAISSFPGRSHFDYCVDYICGLLDEAAACPQMPSGYELNATYGRANKTIIAALKARLLLYAASDLWNGKFPYLNWRNENFETPGYGKELVSYTFDIEKWKRAKTACEDAIRIATANGRRLLELEDAKLLAQRDQLPAGYESGCWIPGIDTSTEEGEEFAYRVLLMRYVAASTELDGNRELIFTSNDIGASNIYGQGTKENVQNSLPRKIIRKNSGNSYQAGYCGISPTLNAVEAFYTQDGKLPKYDNAFPPASEWLTSAGIRKGDEDRSEIIKLNVGREPRFYAWINFDGCDIGPKIVNGAPLRLNLHSSNYSVYNPSTGSDGGGDNQCQTGYLSNKWVSPKILWTAEGADIPNFFYAVIRMAELYLNLAECNAELYVRGGGSGNDLADALENVNLVRSRAGVPELEASDCTSEMSILDWVRAERRNELFMEGHRYYDLRRWVIADQYLAAGMREGLDSFVSKTIDPTLEQFNTRVKVDGDYAWHNRLYLLPVDGNDCYKNPQMVQAPGY